MIKMQFRWENEDYLKARMEPWIAYMSGSGDAEITTPPPTTVPVTTDWEGNTTTPATTAPGTTTTAATTTAGTTTAAGTTTPPATTTPTPTFKYYDPDLPTYDPEKAPKVGGGKQEEIKGKKAVKYMPKLGKVPKMGKAAQRSVHPQELVEWRMNQMMKQTNPYIQAAQTNAKQAAAASGLLNTSIAASAGLDAAIKSILPIAQQDAATLFTQSLENQKVVNEFLMQSFLTRSQFKLEEFGLKVNTYNQGLQRAHEKSENSLQRWWSGEQNRMDRELSVWKSQFDADVTKELATMGYVHDADQNENSCRERATATFNAQIAAITEAWSTDKISHDSYMTQLESAQDQYKAQMNSCKS